MSGLVVLAVLVLLVWSATGRTAETRRNKRLVGYVGASVLGVGLAVVLGLMGLVTGLCNNAMAGPDGCSAEDEAQIGRLFAGAMAAPFVTVGAYAVVDAVIECRRGLRARR